MTYGFTCYSIGLIVKVFGFGVATGASLCVLGLLVADAFINRK